MVRCAGGNGVRLAAGRLDVGDGLIPALLEADAEAGLHQPHLRTHQAAELDVADAVVRHVRPVDPALLNEHNVHAQVGADGRHLPGVVRLDPADRHERVAALGASVGDQVLELARLVAAVGETAVAVVALGPQVRPAEVSRQALQPMHGRGAEQQRDAIKGVELHGRQSASREALPAGPQRSLHRPPAAQLEQRVQPRPARHLEDEDACGVSAPANSHAQPRARQQLPVAHQARQVERRVVAQHPRSVIDPAARAAARHPEQIAGLEAGHLQR